ncbi:MAG: hypothetical protein CMJ54_07275 [Planctomycetaceae bacterium]|nr:hypothetical protein [Planctomycetaceae bacterium]
MGKGLRHLISSNRRRDLQIAMATLYQEIDMNKFLLASSVLALAGSASADIVYSGDLGLTVSSGDAAIDVSIGDNTWQFGVLIGGPLDYTFVTALNEGAGLFVPIANEFSARNFAAGDNIGTFTSVLNMYPLGPGGSTNINLTMHDYVSGEGTFDASGTGFVGFGFGGGIDFNYGWMQFTLDVDANSGSHSITLVDFAYNDEVNGSIEVGAIPAPGAIALLSIAGLAGRRRRNG